MIVGLGVDIAEIDRVREVIHRRGEAFLRRVFTPAERSYCDLHRDRAERYAARFAVKEAAMKALGTGWRSGIRWVDIEVVRHPSGKPSLRLTGHAKEIAESLGARNITMSITHSGNLAFAQVIFES